jgi:hypothetical protein
VQFHRAGPKSDSYPGRERHELGEQRERILYLTSPTQGRVRVGVRVRASRELGHPVRARCTVMSGGTGGIPHRAGCVLPFRSGIRGAALEPGASWGLLSRTIRAIVSLPATQRRCGERTPGCYSTARRSGHSRPCSTNSAGPLVFRTPFALRICRCRPNWGPRGLRNATNRGARCAICAR